MNTLFAASIALNLNPLDWKGNSQKIRTAIEGIRSNNSSAKVLLFPELTLSGVGCEDLFFAEQTSEKALNCLFDLLPETEDITAIVGLPLEYENRLYKAMAVLHHGKLLGFFCSRSIPNQGIHYGARWFSAWSGPQNKIKIEDKPYPIGKDYYLIDPHFHIGIQNETVSSPELDYRPLDLVLIPDAVPFELGKQAVRRNEIAQLSLKKACPVLQANLVGNEAGTLIYDGGAFIAANGELIHQADRFSFADVQWASAQMEKIDGELKITSSKQFLPGWELSNDVLFEEFARAVALGLFDYLRKTRSKGFTLSLSGGADSGAIAVLIRVMAEMGSRSEEFFEKLNYIPAIRELKQKGNPTADSITSALLTTVYQGTRNSGSITRNAAHDVASAIGSVHHVFDIDAIVEAYKTVISESTGRTLSWETDDLALQNIQARTRAPGAWLLANLSGSILLSTGNRSEAACGYATMDGDTCGGLSPIGGIDKAFLRRWLRWMETTGPKDFFAIPALKAINDQEPTAELRPGSGQTDEADLMPYSVLNLFEQAIIRDKLSSTKTLEFVQKGIENDPVCKDMDTSRLEEWMERFYRLWTNSQWKRERFAPAFHLDDHDLSPVSWCRFPILFSGFSG
ncbi:MAG: NAD(+) synthase [Planctomycetia bacterium]|nr:NAD(+) synthase [Planctomycetia bacterium]